jgi:hypothetical protein
MAVAFFSALPNDLDELKQYHYKYCTGVYARNRARGATKKIDIFGATSVKLCVTVAKFGNP